MLSSLPELFGKNFLIGYLLPALLVIVACVGVTDWVNVTRVYPRIMAYVSEPPQPASDTTAKDAIRKASSGKSDDNPASGLIGLFALIGACAAVLATVFLATNYGITLFLQGNGRLNPFRPLKRIQVRRFRRLKKIVDAKEGDYGQAASELAAGFPEEESLVLPTRFGNTQLAAQRYAQQIYDIEPIQTWARLEPIIPARHTELLADAKAQTDFWLNLWIGALSIALLSAVLAVLLLEDGCCVAVVPCLWSGISSASLHAGYALLLSIAVSLICARGANIAAVQYGMYVVSAFDLYRSDLAAKLGLSLPRSVEHEREMWKIFAWTALYVNRDQAQNLTRFRPFDH